MNVYSFVSLWNRFELLIATFRPQTGRAMQERIKDHDRDIRLARKQTSAVSEHANERGHLPVWKEVKFIDRDPHWYIRKVKEAIRIRLILITSIEIVESKFLKLGFLPSKNTTAAQPQSGPVRERHLIVGIIMRIEMPQSQRTNVLQIATRKQSTSSPDED